MSLTHLKIAITDRFRTTKENWYKDPTNHGVDETPPKNRNGITRAAAQIGTGHWWLAAFLKGIKKSPSDLCWFCH